METKSNLTELSLHSTMKQQQSRKVSNHTNNQHHKHAGNRLQNSMRLLMKQATDFQQQQQQKINSNDIISNNDFHFENNNSSIVSGNVDHHPLKQAGVVLQQQIRGLRRRVKSVRSMQLNDDNECCNNSEYENSETDKVKEKKSILCPSSIEGDDGETLHVSNLTPKKNLNVSPIPKNTIKIELQRKVKQCSNYRSPESLPEAIFVWVDACHQLFTGPDMCRFLSRTGSLSYHCTATCVKTVTLPITIPIHIGCITVQGISSIANGMVQRSLSVLADTVPLLHQSSGQGSKEQNHQSRGIVGILLSLPGTIFCITGKIAIAVVAPVLGETCDNSQQKNQKQSTGASSSPEKEKAVYYAKTPSRQPIEKNVANRDYLDRLRLDYVPQLDIECDKLPCRKLFATDGNNARTNPIAVVHSSYLLRVNDWGISRPTDTCDLYYIDISPSAIKLPATQELITLAMDRFVQLALLLLNGHPFCQIANVTTEPDSLYDIQWHPEGSTKRILREMNHATSTTSNPFKDEILIWSGRFQNQVENGYGRNHGFFLARGCIPMSPDNFVKLLWDNTRTSEYNNFCLGRFTLHGLSSSILDDDQSFLDGTSQTASKVIQSEMRVPFAGITVKATCIMHVRPLPTNDGYIICSRSLDNGPSGTLAASSILQKDGTHIVTPAKNEILWGINIIQSMPNHTNGTKLTSLSQVGSAVPSFLAQKIGLMGIGDFFKNVRQVAGSASISN
jgi:hypothetical protein